MGNPLEIAAVFDDWEKTLDPLQREWCRRALLNASGLEYVGDVSAKELIIRTLLFCQGKFPWD